MFLSAGVWQNRCFFLKRAHKFVFCSNLVLWNNLCSSPTTICNRRQIPSHCLHILLPCSTRAQQYRLAIDMGRKVGDVVPLSLGGAGSLSNTMSPGPRPISVPSGILIHPTVWPQYTNVTDRTDRQRFCSIGRAVTCNGRLKKRPICSQEQRFYRLYMFCHSEDITCSKFRLLTGASSMI